jgi:ADP-ribose pyrophosphatase YjhB (NUDIX family)
MDNKSPVLVVGCVIRKDGKYLLIQENRPDIRGLWNVPAGHVDPGEDIEVAARRETKEETGYGVELVRKLGVFYKGGDASYKHVFEAKIAGGELRYPPEEIMDAGWFTFAEVEAMRGKLRRPWVWEAIQMVERTTAKP